MRTNLEKQLSSNPVPRGAAWIRAILAGASGLGAIWAFGYGSVLISRGCMAVMAGHALIWMAGMPLLIVSLVSATIANLLFSNSARGLKAALIFDAAVIIPILTGLVIGNGNYFLHGGHGPVSDQVAKGAVAAAIALACGAEAAWLLTACRGRTRAWRKYGGLAVGLVLLAVGWPLAADFLLVRHVRGLRQYIETRLLVVPADAAVNVSRSWGSTHTDWISFRYGKVQWGFPAHHHDGKGWQVPAAQGNAVSGWAFAVGGRPAPIRSPEEAREYLRGIGVPDNLLGNSQAAGEKFRIDAPAISARYEVGKSGDVGLFLKVPLDVPEP